MHFVFCGPRRKTHDGQQAFIETLNISSLCGAHHAPMYPAPTLYPRTPDLVDVVVPRPPTTNLWQRPAASPFIQHIQVTSPVYIWQYSIQDIVWWGPIAGCTQTMVPKGESPGASAGAAADAGRFREYPPDRRMGRP